MLWTEARTTSLPDNVKTAYPPQTKFAGCNYEFLDKFKEKVI